MFLPCFESCDISSMPAESTLTPSKVHLSHQDTSSPAPPTSNTVHTGQLAVPPDALLFCTSELLHGSPARTVPSSSNTGKCPLFQEAAALSGPGVKPDPLGVCHSCPLSGFLPFIPSVVLSWRPTCSPSPPCQPRPGPLRYETGSGARPCRGQRLRKFPCWELCAPVLGTSWRQPEGAQRKGCTFSTAILCSLPLCSQDQV